ncbi:MAG TPA: AMP-binding protein [Acidimicrobiales bacterium]|nr:AMP-binding protein [Acidimicrobiales bacterium]
MQHLLEQIDERGDGLALTDEFGSWTWSELNDRLNRLVHGLRGLGLGLGDTVAVVGNNRHEWCEVNRPGFDGGSGYWFPTPAGSACWAA